MSFKKSIEAFAVIFGCEAEMRDLECLTAAAPWYWKVIHCGTCILKTTLFYTVSETRERGSGFGCKFRTTAFLVELAYTSAEALRHLDAEGLRRRAEFFRSDHSPVEPVF
jgi:hypothetical protein